jgi:hypothetical protein
MESAERYATQEVAVSGLRDELAVLDHDGSANENGLRGAVDSLPLEDVVVDVRVVLGGPYGERARGGGVKTYFAPAKSGSSSADSSTNRYCVQVSPQTARPAALARPMASIAGSHDTWTTYRGQSARWASSIARCVASPSVSGGRVRACQTGSVFPAARASRTSTSMTSPFSAWTITNAPDAADRAGREIVAGDGPPERHVHVRVRVDRAGKQVFSAGVDDPVGSLRETVTDERDRGVVNVDVVGCRDDTATLDQHGHRVLRFLLATAVIEGACGRPRRSAAGCARERGCQRGYLASARPTRAQRSWPRRTTRPGRSAAAARRCRRSDRR